MPFTPQPPIPRNAFITAEYLVSEMRETVEVDISIEASPSGWESRKITEADLHRPGLALAGHVNVFSHQRIQILGNTEIAYLNELSETERNDAFARMIDFDIPVIFTTHGNQLMPGLMNMAAEKGIPVFRTETETTKFMFLLRDFLEDQFALQTIVHGSMVDVYGIGLLFTGKSGIGKSEVALDLVERGHRLVGDDVLILTNKNNVLMAAATEINKHFMEIRGLGIVDVMKMFGIRSIRYQKRLEIIVDLFLWDGKDSVERTGLEHEHTSILDVKVPIVRLPITPGKNITVIAEVIAMNHLLSHYGYDAAAAFQDKVKQRIAEKKDNDKGLRRAIRYFERDFE